MSSSSSNNSVKYHRKPFADSNTISILHNPCLWNIPSSSHGEATNSMVSFSAKEVSFFGGEEENDNEDEIGEEPSAKKRRLSSRQVEFLEKSFEVENKPEPERKVQLAKDLGLQPRQVAIWFQNRRARFKTKQLEHDFDALRNSYDCLKSEYDTLLAQNDALKLQVDSLKEKLGAVEEKSESQLVKPEASSENEQSDLSPDEDDELGQPPLLFLPKLESCYYDEDDEPCGLGFAAAEDNQPFNFWPYDEQNHVM